MDTIPYEELPARIDGLPAFAAELARADGVSFLPVGHPDVPERLAKAIARRISASQTGAAPSCCDFDGSTGGILIVLGNVAHLEHELVHAAQVLASFDALDESFHAVAAEGKAIAVEARRLIREGRPVAEHRDLKWAMGATDSADPGRVMANMGMHMNVHPTRATLEIGRGLSLPDRDAVNAAVWAYYMAMKGMDPATPAARECVAHRHQGDLAPLRELFDSALELAFDRRPIAGLG